jgi:DNA-binding GntR family transcriptional regulator
VARPSRIDLDRSAIPEQIARGLIRLVLSGEPPPGQPLHEGSIASDLGVSRNTVREAVRILERSGLVYYESNRGAVVREPSRGSLADVYRARLAIEVGAAWAAAANAVDPSGIDAALCALGTKLAEGDTDAAITADLQFHGALVAAAQSTRLTEAFAAVLNELRLYLTALSARAAFQPVRPVLREHEAIGWAAKRADRQELVEMLAGHISNEATEVLTLLGPSCVDSSLPGRNETTNSN